MRKINVILYTLIISIIFIGNVSASNFTCTVDGYKLEYDPTGKIVSATDNTSGEKINKNLFSDFHPKKVSECPTSEEAQVSTIDRGMTLYISASNVANKDETGSQKEVDLGGCSGYTDEESCEYNASYSCIWNVNEFSSKGYCNTDNLLYVRCGDAFDIPYQAPTIISFIVNFLKILTPILLIILSVISLLKALASSNEDEIKKAQKSLIKKIISAVMVFFVVSIVQFVVLIVADTDNSKGASEADNLSSCLSCFLNDDCNNTLYYKTNDSGKYYCTYASDPNNPEECE